MPNTDGSIIARLSALEIITEFMWKKALQMVSEEEADVLLTELRRSVMHLATGTSSKGTDGLALESRLHVERFCDRLGPKKHVG